MSFMPKQRKTPPPSNEPSADRESPDFSTASTDRTTPDELNLADHFLIAMPSMLDPVFGGTVVYLCEHNANGALGVIINRATDMSVHGLLDRVDLALEIVPDSERTDPGLDQAPVIYGGPVQSDRGFVLHTPQGDFSSTLPVTDEIAFTTSKDVLEALAVGRGPERLLISLGCSGWGAGQLEEELAQNAWLTVPAEAQIIFDMAPEERLSAAIHLLGIDFTNLSDVAGHA
jgi:putative transcriptional regulator